MDSRAEKRQEGYWLAWGVFLFYFSLGMSLSRLNTPTTNVYFGADNARAYNDLTRIFTNHYRIKVHPLFLILLQPVVLLLKGIFQDPATTVVVVEALAGTVLVTEIHFMLEKLCGDPAIHWLLTLIFTASFSNMIFATVPETMIFAAVFLSVFWAYVLYHMGTGAFSPMQKMLLCFMGITNFGITLTNYVQYLLGLSALLLASSYTWKEKKSRTTSPAGGLLLGPTGPLLLPRLKAV